MKELLHALVAGQPDAFARRRLAREYLQARILLALQDRGAFADWAFLGGTALRFLFQLPRFSEDLDFALTEPGRDARFTRILTGVKTDLEGEAYDVEVRLRERQAVASAMVKFRGLLYEIGASPRKDETLAVKVEVDTNPPAGAGLATRAIRRHLLLHLLHYDRASLLAGKLHAVLMRKYTKGRDLYDLAWYLSDPGWPPPNLTFLNNALAQTGWPGPELTDVSWRAAVVARLARMDWKQARADVSPFLERSKDMDLISPEVLGNLLAGEASREDPVAEADGEAVKGCDGTEHWRCREQAPGKERGGFGAQGGRGQRPRLQPIVAGGADGATEEGWAHYPSVRADFGPRISDLVLIRLIYSCAAAAFVAGRQ